MEKLPSSLDALASTLGRLSDTQLLAEVDRTAAHGREVTADLIALRQERDIRQLYAAEGYTSLFEFCVARLRLSESQAYHRIQAARAVRRFPLVLDRLRDGRVTLTAVALLREHLTEVNHREVLDWAEGRRKREVEEYIRRLNPRPDVRTSIRRLASVSAVVPVAAAVERDAAADTLGVAASPAAAAPATAPAPAPLLFASSATPPSDQPPRATRGDSESPRHLIPVAADRLSSQNAPRGKICPLAPARYSLHVTLSQETHDKLRRAQDLLRHADPSADPPAVIDRALTLLVAQLERRKAGARKNAVTPETRSPRAPRPAPERKSSRRPRYIPAAIRRTVWDRDGGRCTYVSPNGVRCAATSRLEFHHKVPFAEGGPSTVENLTLSCTRHNAVEAKRWFNFAWAESELSWPESTRLDGASSSTPGRSAS